MNDKLKSAENTIHFIQKEHERVLHGLHMEIERLQQKCSGNLLFNGSQLWDVFEYLSTKIVNRSTQMEVLIDQTNILYKNLIKCQTKRM